MKVNQKTRIPRHYVRFTSLIGKILQEKETIITKQGEKLIEYLGTIEIQQLITKLKGEKGHVIGYTRKGEQTNLKNHLQKLLKKGKNPIIHVVGAFPKGTYTKITEKTFDEKIAITKYSLTTSATLCRIITVLEEILHTKEADTEEMNSNESNRNRTQTTQRL